MAATLRVLMVCMGNICRSPTAEAMLRRLVDEAGLSHRIQVDSAGTHDYHVGAPPDARAIDHGRRHGLDLTPLRGRQVEPADLDRFDYVVAMDRDNLVRLQTLARRRPKASRARIELLLAWARGADTDEVPDPYYGGPEGFDRVIGLVQAGCAGLLAHLRDELDAADAADAADTAR